MRRATQASIVNSLQLELTELVEPRLSPERAMLQALVWSGVRDAVNGEELCYREDAKEWLLSDDLEHDGPGFTFREACGHLNIGDKLIRRIRELVLRLGSERGYRLATLTRAPKEKEVKP